MRIIAAKIHHSELIQKLDTIRKSFQLTRYLKDTDETIIHYFIFSSSVMQREDEEKKKLIHNAK